MKGKILAVMAFCLIGLIIWQQNSDSNSPVTPQASIPSENEKQQSANVQQGTPEEVIPEDLTTSTTDVTENQITAPELEPKGEKLPWRKPSEHFAKFQDLSEKPLIKPEEREQFLSLINSYQMVEKAKEILFEPVSGPELDFTEERARLDAVDYLATLVSGKYNSSQLDHAIQLIFNILNTKRTDDTFSLDLKRSLVGDKVELGIALAVFQSDIWQQYKSTYQADEKQTKLIAYIDQEAEFNKERLKINAQRIANRLKDHSQVK